MIQRRAFGASLKLSRASARLGASAGGFGRKAPEIPDQPLFSSISSSKHSIALAAYIMAGPPPI